MRLSQERSFPSREGEGQKISQEEMLQKQLFIKYVSSKLELMSFLADVGHEEGKTKSTSVSTMGTF